MFNIDKEVEGAKNLRGFIQGGLPEESVSYKDIAEKLDRTQKELVQNIVLLGGLRHCLSTYPSFSVGRVINEENTSVLFDPDCKEIFDRKSCKDLEEFLLEAIALGLIDLKPVHSQIEGFGVTDLQDRASELLNPQ